MAYVGGVVDKTQLATIAPRGTIRRFASAGAINTLLFWLFWEILRLSPALAYISETGAWAVAWVMFARLLTLLTVTLPSTAAKMSRLL